MVIEIRQTTKTLFSILVLMVGLLLMMSEDVILTIIGVFPFGGGLFYLTLEAGESYFKKANK